MHPVFCRLLTAVAMAAGALLPANRGEAAEAAAFTAALESITAKEMRQYVEVLANDTFEGRAAGTRGGRAAAVYLTQQFKRLGLKPGGTNGTSYYQPFGSGYQNILGILEGSDPELKNEYVVIGAHFDHVGYGTARNSYGPTGFIHNGADDNASGDAALLEIVEAFNVFGSRPKRSILFALWDCEEAELNGSNHWTKAPTIPRTHVALAFNLDMVGRLRNHRLEIIGSRSAAGLRRAVSQCNVEQDMTVDFEWEITRNSDHWSFYQVGIPIVFVHTGLHNDYHRPSDDPEKLNYQGMQGITQLVFRLAYQLADADERPKFRSHSRQEGVTERMALERTLPPPPGRLGIRWDDRDTTGPGLRVIQVDRGSAAERAGIRSDDRLMDFGGMPLDAKTDLRPIVLAAKSPVKATIARGEALIDVELPLPDAPLRVGISWREDAGEPGTLIVVQVVAGSPAERAGIHTADRIYAVGGENFANGSQFVEQVAAIEGPIPMTLERAGRVFSVTLAEASTAAQHPAEN
jgi:hypothetical protein